MQSSPNRKAGCFPPLLGHGQGSARGLRWRLFWASSAWRSRTNAHSLWSSPTSVTDPPESRPNSAHAALGWQLQSPLEWKYRPPVCRSSDTATTLMIDMYPWVSCWPWYCLKFSYESFCPWRHLQQEFAPTSELLRSSAVEWPNSVGWTWRHMFNVLRLKPVWDLLAAIKHVLISVIKGKPDW